MRKAVLFINFFLGLFLFRSIISNNKKIKNERIIAAIIDQPKKLKVPKVKFVGKINNIKAYINKT